jgi:D-alanyl-D-alanine carboxypeptidase
VAVADERGVAPPVGVPPDPACPPRLVADQRIVTVRYVGFDGVDRVGHIEVHRSVVADVASFFELAYALRFPIERVVQAGELAWSDPQLMAENCTSGFNFRTVLGRDVLSLHSLGLAFDVNTRLMPYIRVGADGELVVQPPGAHYDPSVPGTLVDGHPLVRHLLDLGWRWGGHWSLERDGVVDYQHFEKRPPAAEHRRLLESYDLPGSGVA